MTDQWTTSQAAEHLGFSGQAVREFAMGGHLSSFTTSGMTGRGRKRYFRPGEVRAFKKGGAVAAKAYRQAHGIPEPVPQQQKV